MCLFIKVRCRARPAIARSSKSSGSRCAGVQDDICGNWILNSRSKRGGSEGARPTLDPPFGLHSDWIDFPKPSLDASWAARRVFGSLCGPSKHRSKRKMKVLKFAQYFPQILSPGQLLLIQVPPQRPPLDLIHSTKGLLGPRPGAKNTSWDLSWTLLE